MGLSRRIPAHSHRLLDQAVYYRWIETPNDSREETSSNWLEFDVGGQSSTVYVAYDANATQLPAWLTTNFTSTGDSITVDHANAPILDLYQMSNVTGAVSLGGNLEGNLPTGIANYIVIVTR